MASHGLDFLDIRAHAPVHSIESAGIEFGRPKRPVRIAGAVHLDRGNRKAQAQRLLGEGLHDSAPGRRSCVEAYDRSCPRPRISHSQRSAWSLSNIACMVSAIGALKGPTILMPTSSREASRAQAIRD